MNASSYGVRSDRLGFLLGAAVAQAESPHQCLDQSVGRDTDALHGVFMGHGDLSSVV